jgi:hypothetical protein
MRARGLAFKRQDYLSHEHRKLTSQPRPHQVKKSKGVFSLFGYCHMLQPEPRGE